MNEKRSSQINTDTAALMPATNPKAVSIRLKRLAILVSNNASHKAAVPQRADSATTARKKLELEQESLGLQPPKKVFVKASQSIVKAGADKKILGKPPKMTLANFMVGEVGNTLSFSLVRIQTGA